MDDQSDLSDAELEEWDRLAREEMADPAHRNIGTVARDRKIRRLVEELRRERERARRPRDPSG